MAVVRSILRRAFPGVATKLFLQLPTLLVIGVCRRFRRKPEQGRESILIFRLDGIGDCVMAIPFFEQVRELFPAAHITLVTGPAPKPLMEALSSVDEVLVLQPALPSIFHRYLRQLAGAFLLYRSVLRFRRFQKVINPRWDTDLYFAALLAGLVRGPESISYEDGASPEKKITNRGFQKVWTRVLPAGPVQHEVLRNTAVAQALGWTGGAIPPSMTPSATQREAAIDWLGSEPGYRVALGLPASGAMRRWSASHYVEMLREVSKQVSIVPVLFADDSTLESAQEILAAFPSAKIAYQLPLVEVAAILSECAAFAGSDSGLGHLSAAVGCPTITVSPHPANAHLQHMNSPARFRPLGERCVFIQPAMARHGCEAGCISTIAHCILDISADEVAKAILPFLTSNPAPQSGTDQAEDQEVSLVTMLER
jgi:ADP-heptose:LPS heptosyltransferase